uniref:PIN domain-containing protein n=1 Tax=Candidatus Electronema sp. TaxID=2698783 RepID=UPI004056B47C
MKVMLDLNVVLDVLQSRHPYYHASASVISKVCNKEIFGLLPSHAITTIHYVISKYSGKQKADESIDWMLAHFDVAAADKAAFVRARSLRFSDFEDSVVASLAESAQCDLIITRNIADFKQSPISALTPEEFLNQCDRVI